MPRMTRAKLAEVTETLHLDVLEASDENAGLNTKVSTPEPSTFRAPLGEIAPNSADSTSTTTDDGAHELKKSTRGKKAKKATKNKKKIPKDHELEVKEQEEGVPLFIDDTTPGTSPSEPQRQTRSQLAALEKTTVEVEPKSLVDGLGQTPEEREQDIVESTLQVHDPFGSDDGLRMTALDAPASPLPSAMPNVIKSLRNETPGKRSTSNKENVEPIDFSPLLRPSSYDVLEDAAVQGAAREGHASPRPEDHITAMDELDEALESASKDIPDVQTSPEKPARKAASAVKPNTAIKREPKKAAPVVRTTKASQARLSMFQSTQGPPPMLGRSNSVRLPAKQAASTTAAKANRSSILVGEKKEVVIPHSKPRPVSMSFPTPPPPPKSTRAPTQSTFKLPGEAVAEKLKAQREARQAKEVEEEAKKKPFKARPVPSSLKAAPMVRSTTASKARQSTISGKETGPASTHKRAASVATMSTTSRPLAMLNRSTAAKPSTKPDALAVRKRASTAMAELRQPRTAMAASVGPSKGTAKGKEVFNRVTLAKDTAEREKREKEAAAKQARADAAERGRQASREWAEKQRLRKLAPSKAEAKEPVVVAEQA